jgi:putative ABC transport system permease protein
VTKLPFRNVLRGRRRTLLTAFGIGAAVTTLVAVVGMIDSFVATIDRGEEEIVGDDPDRVVVGLDFVPTDSSTVESIAASPLVDRAEPELTLGGVLEPGGDDEIEVLLVAIDFESPLWTPTTLKGSLDDEAPGLVLAEKAADDLDVTVGDTVSLRHPRREGLTGYQLVETELPVLAIHPNPYRFVTYLDRAHVGFMELEGVTNTLAVSPADGVAVEDVQRGLFETPGVVSIEPVTATADAIRDQIEEVLGIFTVIQGAVLLMAALIAFNSAAINMDERAREHATMFAFGLPSRTVMTMAVVESVIIGVTGTVIGVVTGRLVLEWLIRVLLPESFPEIGILPTLSSSTVATAVVLGTVAVALAPLFTMRRLRRMDIPATLRVME